MKEKLIALLTFTSSLKSFGMKFIRVAILVVFVWIGGLKYFHYEADGIVPFVANSPFMSFFYAKGAPEYKEHKNAEGAFVPENLNPEKPDVPLNKNDAFQKVQKRRVQEKR